MAGFSEIPAIPQNETVTNLHGLKMLVVFTQGNLFLASSLLISCTNLLRKLVVSITVIHCCSVVLMHYNYLLIQVSKPLEKD
jgi:hypothetical protein